MKPFNELCKIVEQLSPSDYAAIVAEKSGTIHKALSVLADGESATDLYAMFILGAIYADGKLDKSEFELISPMLKIVFGDGFDYNSAKKLTKYYHEEGKDLTQIVDMLVDTLGLLSDDLKDDIVILSLLICAIDGKISAKEKKYIQQLMR